MIKIESESRFIFARVVHNDKTRLSGYFAPNVDRIPNCFAIWKSQGSIGFGGVVGQKLLS